MKTLNLPFLIILGLLTLMSCKGDDITTIPEKRNPFIDSRDGQEYGTVTIGDQIWMDENLNYNPQRTGALYYDNDSIKNHMYGRLYLWETLMNGESSSASLPSGVQGLCPDGWHIPSMAEWDILANYLETNNMTGRDLMDTKLWSPAGVATNSTGFSGKPAGTMWDTMGPGSDDQSSANINTTTNFMSSEGDETESVLFVMALDSDGSFYEQTNLWIYNYWSCRCVKD